MLPHVVIKRAKPGKTARSSHVWRPLLAVPLHTSHDLAVGGLKSDMFPFPIWLFDQNLPPWSFLRGWRQVARAA